MKTKSLTIQIPAKFRWIATQPYGVDTLFKTKPTIQNNGDYDINNNLIEFWNCGDGDIDIDLGEIESCPNWRETLRKI